MVVLHIAEILCGYLVIPLPVLARSVLNVPVAAGPSTVAPIRVWLVEVLHRSYQRKPRAP